jgi:hypothetical protein
MQHAQHLPIPTKRTKHKTTPNSQQTYAPCITVQDTIRRSPAHIQGKGHILVRMAKAEGTRIQHHRKNICFIIPRDNIATHAKKHQTSMTHVTTTNSYSEKSTPSHHISTQIQEHTFDNITRILPAIVASSIGHLHQSQSTKKPRSRSSSIMHTQRVHASLIATQITTSALSSILIQHCCMHQLRAQ